MVNCEKSDSLKHIKKYIAFIVLLSLGMVGNYASIPLYMGVDYIFGSIFVITILYFYGLKLGLAASILVNVFTYRLWHHPYAIIIFTLEIVFIGVAIKRKGNSIIFWDSLYWLVIGGPLSAIIYHSFLGYSSLDLVLIILKDSVNGIFNTFCANLIIFYTPLEKIILDRKKEKSISLNKMIFSLIVGSVIVYNMIINVINTRDYLIKIRDGIKGETQSLINMSTYNINSWYTQYSNALNILGQRTSYTDIKYSNELQQYTSIVQSSLPAFYGLYIVDLQGKVVAASPRINEHGVSNIGTYIRTEDYFKNAEFAGMMAVSDTFTASKNYTLPAVAIGIPIIKNNKVEGNVIGIINLNYIPISLKEDKNHRHINITIINKNNSVIASTDNSVKVMGKLSWDSSLIIDNIDHLNLESIKELSDMRTLEKSIYVQRYNISRRLPWKLIMQVPLDEYKEGMQQYYIKNFSITFLVIISSLLITIVLDKVISYPIFQLAKVTTHLPSKIFKEEIIEWPGSIIKEIDLLINNFKATSKILKENFKDIQDSNLELKYIANYDYLTRLPNRTLFKTELDKALDTAKKNNSKVALMFLDLDRFKVINDTLGHNVGDNLLKEVSKRLHGVLDEEEIIFRIGGDEFILLAPNINETEKVNKVASKILGVFREPYLLSGQELNITTSIGIAIFPQDGEEGEVLLTNADIAMYRAKEKGKNNYQFYNIGMNKLSLEQFKIENSLRKALENDEFILYYQPRIEADTEKIIGAEALIRWNSPELGMVTPDKFISIAEETGLIVSIGELIIRKACKQNRIWHDMGLDEIRVSVNLSALQFSQQDLVEKIEKILKETNLEPKWLEVEITEGTAIRNIKFTIYMLEKLKAMGIKISLDDFGTGFSSLNYLKNFKIDTLKIDSSFVRDINEDAKNTAIVSSIINLAKSLNLNVTAEGVETKEQLSFLKTNGCDEIQGYLFSKPLPPEKFEKYVKEQIMKNKLE